MSELSAKVPDTPGARQSANEQAVKLAVAGRWQEAAALNRELIARFGDDAEVYNRLGKAFTELGRIKDARLVYERALAVDPTNAIAQRNLDRLAQAKEEAPAAEPTAQMSRGLFIEEVGKAAVGRRGPPRWGRSTRATRWSWRSRGTRSTRSRRVGSTWGWWSRGWGCGWRG